MKLHSLRSKIFAAFIGYSFLGIAISGLAMYYFGKASHINEVAAEVDVLLVETLELLRYEQGFSSYDLIDPAFHKYGRSENLNNHRSTLDRIFRRLDSLMENERLSEIEISKRGLGDHLLELRAELASYGKHFDNYVELSLQRGFKDHGLVGRMRVAAHEIEAHPVGLSMVDVLLLRRHEKDYIIRKDRRYASKLIGKALEIQEQLKADGDPKSLQSYALLVAYRTNFEALVTIEEQIGLNNQAGAIGNMRLAANNLANLSETLSAGMSVKVSELRSNQMTFFSCLMVGALFLAILFGLVLSRRITRPVGELTRAVRETVESNFKKPVSRKVWDKQDEVGLLAKDFQTMLEALHKQLAEISRQTEDLSDKNVALEGLNAQLNASKDELQNINNVKNKVFSIISHDFRSPLHSLLGYLGLFEENAEAFTKDQLKHFSKDIKEKVRRLLNVLENTLQWSMHESGRLEYMPVWNDLHELSDEALALYEGRAEKKAISLKLEVAKGKRGWGDKRMLQFLLRNLISNAIKFSPRGSEVVLGCRQEGNRLRMTVTDQGLGMTQEQIEKVLSAAEHYSSTGTDNEQGTGFGLVLCKQFAMAHGGPLSIDSVLGKGTSVHFEVASVDNKGLIHPTAVLDSKSAAPLN